MKDENDNVTVDFILPAQGRKAAIAPAGARVAAVPLPAGWYKPKAQPKRGNCHARTVQDVSGKVPDCATPPAPGVLNQRYYVPVSFAAKDWQVTPRRIRSLLTAKRLEGRREANGYWEVAYPYRFTIGTRGPVLKRQQKPKRGRPKAELSAV